MSSLEYIIGICYITYKILKRFRDPKEKEEREEVRESRLVTGAYNQLLRPGLQHELCPVNYVRLYEPGIRKFIHDRFPHRRVHLIQTETFPCDDLFLIRLIVDGKHFTKRITHRDLESGQVHYIIREFLAWVDDALTGEELNEFRQHLRPTGR